MLKLMGTIGVVGVVFVLLGIVLVAVESLILATGLTLVVGGAGLIAYGMVSRFMKAMGMPM